MLTSEGSRNSIPPARTPSTIYKGSDFLLEPAPLTLMLIPAPGAPELGITLTPAVLPCRAWSILPEETVFRSSAFIEEIAPVTRLFFCVPYPMTTISLSAVSSDSNATLIVLPDTVMTWAFIPN
ncbi:hypothetical protein D3C85_1166490 [compost metagenome]